MHCKGTTIRMHRAKRYHHTHQLYSKNSDARGREREKCMAKQENTETKTIATHGKCTFFIRISFKLNYARAFTLFSMMDDGVLV